MNVTILSPEFSGDPEAMAMLQAYYSRSETPIKDRLEALGGNLTTVKNSLSKFYVGYGHESIGDCATVTLFIEGVSILLAKAVQDDLLYNGQECSTRYIELKNGCQTDVDYSTPEYPDGLQKAWLDLYSEVKVELVQALEERFPYEEGTNKTVWQNAINAGAFDIARGWLPAGLLTNLSLTGSFRTIRRIALWLASHPLKGAADLSLLIRKTVNDCYPSVHPVEFSEQELRQIKWNKDTNFFYEEQSTVLGNPNDIRVYSLEAPGFEIHRSKYISLPKGYNAFSTYTVSGSIDYGSWRDLQRHRTITARPPLVRPTFELHSWYMNSLVSVCTSSWARLRDQTNRLMTVIALEVAPLARDAVNFQNVLPLGTPVPVSFQIGLADAVYFAELRSGKTVHATLRPFAQSLARYLTAQDIEVHADLEDKPFVTLARGKQTIVAKDDSVKL
jgi:thymidylate synthase ThyX